MSSPMSGKVRFQAALQGFRDSLNPKEKTELDTSYIPGRDGVVHFVQDLHNRKFNDARFQEWSQRVMPLLKATQQFSGVVDTFTQINPATSSIFWGSIKLVIVASFNFLDYVEKTGEMFQRLGNLCPGFTRFEKLYSGNVELQDSICNFYATVMTFCKEVMDFTRSSRIKTIIKSMWKDLKSKHMDVICELSAAKEVINLEISYASDKAASDERQRQAIYRLVTARHRNYERIEWRDSREWRLEQDLERKKTEWESLIEKVSRYPYSSTFYNFRERRLEGTGGWLLEAPEVKEWECDPKSKKIWLNGIPGSGKSVLTAGLIDDLFTKRGPKDFICYFFCTFLEPDSLSPRTVLDSLIKQVLVILGCDVPGLNQDIKWLYSDAKSKTQQITSFLCRLVDDNVRDGKVYIILDGLDECKDSDRYAILSFLNTLVEQVRRGCVKVLVSSRTELDIRDSVEDWIQLPLSPSRNSGDLEKYIKDEMVSRQDQGQLKGFTAELIKDVIEAVTRRSTGLILMAHFQIEEICSENDEQSIRHSLETLPAGLHELFERILKRILVDKKSELARQIFSWIICTKRSLTIDELAEAISFRPGFRYWSDRVPQLDHIKMLRNCGPLIIHNKTTRTVDVAHQTVMEYLTSKSAVLPNFFIDMNKEDLGIGLFCLTYLGFGNLKSAVAKPVKLDAAINFDPAQLIPIVLQGNSSSAWMWSFVSSLVYPVPRDPRKSTSRNSSTTVNQVSKPSPSTTTNAYKIFILLDYVAEYWVEHCRHLETTSPSWEQFAMMTEESFTFPHLPWCWGNEGVDEGSASIRIWQQLDWALEQDHAPILRVVLDKLSRFELASDQHADKIQLALTTAFQYSCKQGKLWIVKLMLSYNFSDPKSIFRLIRKRCQRSLLHAIEEDQCEVVEMLLQSGWDPNLDPEWPNQLWHEKGHTLLEIAASRGNVNIVDALLKAGVNPDVVSPRGYSRTALQSAAKNGHISVAEKLLESGADINKTDPMEESTPMQLAENSGHAELVLKLKEYGADDTLNPPNIYNTPYHGLEIDFYVLPDLISSLYADAPIQESDACPSQPTFIDNHIPLERESASA